MYRSQTVGQVWLANEYEQAYDIGGGMVVHGETARGGVPVRLEPWSTAQLCYVCQAEAKPVPDNAVQCVVAEQTQTKHDPIRGPYVWWGAMLDWAAAVPSSIG